MQKVLPIPLSSLCNLNSDYHQCFTRQRDNLHVHPLKYSFSLRSQGPLIWNSIPLLLRDTLTRGKRPFKQLCILICTDTFQNNVRLLAGWAYKKLLGLKKCDLKSEKNKNQLLVQYFQQQKLHLKLSNGGWIYGLPGAAWTPKTMGYGRVPVEEKNFGSQPDTYLSILPGQLCQLIAKHKR